MATSLISKELTERIYNEILEVGMQGITTSQLAKKLGYTFASMHTGCFDLLNQNRIEQADGYYYNKQGKQVHYNMWIAI